MPSAAEKDPVGLSVEVGAGKTPCWRELPSEDGTAGKDPVERGPLSAADGTGKAPLWPGAGRRRSPCPCPCPANGPVG